jgi:hypothetical protein
VVAVGLSGPFDEADDDVVGVTVKFAAGPIIPRRHPGVAVSYGDLHIPQRNAGVQAGGDVSQRMRTEVLVDADLLGQTDHDPGCGASVHLQAVDAQKQRTRDPVAGSCIHVSSNRVRQGNSGWLPASHLPALATMAPAVASGH